jgi:hypothetical protein
MPCWPCRAACGRRCDGAAMASPGNLPGRDMSRGQAAGRESGRAGVTVTPAVPGLRYCCTGAAGPGLAAGPGSNEKWPDASAASGSTRTTAAALSGP